VNVAIPLAGGILSFNANDITPSSHVGLTPQLLAFDPKTEGGFSTGLTTGKLVAPGATDTYRWYAGHITVTNTGVLRNKTQFTLAATPVEFGAAGLMPADRIKGSENGMVGAIIVEPQESCWITDPGTRAQATVWKGTGLSGECGITPSGSTESFRDFVTIMQNDVNLRYGGDATATGGANCTDLATLRTMACAVPSIAAEGPLGPPEDPQDTGQKAINYGADPLWFRLGITPDTPFGTIHRNAGLTNLIPDVFSNSLAGVGGDPQTEVYRASPTGPAYGRFRVVMPGGHARGTTYTLHGHEWQTQPYINGSSEIGDRPISEYFGVQEGINPTGHWDFVTEMGGYFGVTGDYLWRDQASFGSYQGLWGLLRFELTAPIVGDVFASVANSSSSEPILLGADLGADPVTAITIKNATGTGTLLDPWIVGTGRIVDNGNGTVTYTSVGWPGCADSFSCIEELTYTATNAVGTSAEAILFVEVTNTAPLARPDVAELFSPPDTTVEIPILANDFDAEGDLIDLARDVTVNFFARGNDYGTATFDPLTRIATYTYNGSLPGNSGVDEIEYSVTDESGAESNRAVLRIGVNVDSITIARARYQESIDRLSVDGTCSVPDNTITVHFGESTMGTPVIGVGVCSADNLWSVRGQAENAGIVVSITEPNYVSAVSSGEGAFWGFLLDIVGQNNPPTADPDAYAGGFFNGILSVPAPGVLGNDTDADGDGLTATLETAPSLGLLVLAPNGSFTYEPDTNTYIGSDSFTYVANDGVDNSASAVVTIGGPVALPDTFSMLPLGTLGGNVLLNDLATASVNATVVSGPSEGSLALATDGSFTYDHTGSAGLDTFTYQICAGPVCATASASININTTQNAAPLAFNDAYSAVQNTALTVVALDGVLANDTDADGDALSVAAVNGVPEDVGVEITLASGATLTLNADGWFTYTPFFNFVGLDSFTYVANDTTVDSNPATVTITVEDVVTVTSAQYRTGSGRWQIDGTVSNFTSSVNVYLCSDFGCTSPQLIGAANVDQISGAWNLNTRTGPRPNTDPQANNWVKAVSNFGGESAPFPVRVRN
ncbi:MAG: Ig-like domain-containing protein, partial [Planctomycetota bacterium]|jgi:hypothetical protein